MAYLSVENLEKAFGGTRVLRDVSFQLPEGETLSWSFRTSTCSPSTQPWKM